MSLELIYARLDALLSDGAGSSAVIAANTLAPSVTAGAAARKRSVEVAVRPRYLLEASVTRVNISASSAIDAVQLRDVEITVLLQQELLHYGRKGKARHERRGEASDLAVRVERCLTFPGNLVGTGLVSGMIDLVSISRPRLYPEEKLMETALTFRGVLLTSLAVAPDFFLVASNGDSLITDAGDQLVARA